MLGRYATVLGYIACRSGLNSVLMGRFWFGFSLTAFVGYKGLDMLSHVAVPAMLGLLFWSLWIATHDAGGLEGPLAIGGMYDMLIPFLTLLGSVIPPIGGVINADFFHGHKGRYPRLASTTLPRFNWIGLGPGIDPPRQADHVQNLERGVVGGDGRPGGPLGDRPDNRLGKGRGRAPGWRLTPAGSRARAGRSVSAQACS